MKLWAFLLAASLFISIVGCTPIQETVAMDVDQTSTTEVISDSSAELPTSVPPEPTTKPTQTPFPTRDTAETTPDFFTFVGTDAEGVDFSVESLRGTPFMMLFFSVRCGHCHSEAEHLEELYQSYVDQGFSIVAFEASGANSDSIRDFAETYGLTFPVLSENNQSLAFQMGVAGVPSNFFVNEAGEIVDKVIGYREGDELQKTIEALLESD